MDLTLENYRSIFDDVCDAIFDQLGEPGYNPEQALEGRYKGKLDKKAVHHRRRRKNAAAHPGPPHAFEGHDGSRFVSVDSNNAVQRALTNLKTGIEESGAIITVDALPVVTADESRLLQNLVGNAIKYRNGTPHIHVFCRHMEDIARAAAGNRHGPGWLFSVQDDGIGIDQQYFDRIFQAFERLHSRREYPGTGMGLAICKTIVERHGGSIWVSSEPGKGSTSYFTLPDAVGNAGPEAEESLMNRN